MDLAVQPAVFPRNQRIEGVTLRASIIIVNYNAKEKLMRCLASTLRSGEDACEVIVVDNDSSDGSADAIETRFPDVILIRSDKNLGFGAGNNLGARRAKGKYLVFLNPDTLVEAGWMNALLAPFELDDSAGLVTAKILLADQPDRINTCGNTVHFTGLTLCRGLGAQRETLRRPEEVDAVSGAAFAIPSELFETLGGFDEDTFLYMEDTDLSLRARLAGWHCLYAPEAIVFHDYNLRITPLKVFYQERNRYLMLLKCFRWPTLMIMLPAQLLAEVVTWGFVLRSDRKNFKNKFRAYYWIFANWSSILRKRKKTQALRKATDRKLLQHTSYRLEFSQADKGTLGWLAQSVFNPLFFLLRGLTMMLVWW